MELVEASGETIAGVARDLNLNDTTLGNGVEAARAERGVPDESGLLRDGGAPPRWSSPRGDPPQRPRR